MISILIPTLNAEESIGKLLRSLREQDLSLEIVVIDSSSSDNTVNIARSYGVEIIEIDKDSFDHGGTRTQGAKISKGEILVFMTQDSLPVDEHSIMNLINPLYKEKTIAAVYGRQLAYPNASPFAAHLRLFNFPPVSRLITLDDKNRLGIKAAFLSNSFSAYRKSTLEEIGWFKNGLGIAEDVYAGAKMLLAGYKIAYAAEALVYHSHNYTIFQEFKRYFTIGIFHKTQDWIIKEFGRAEEEGLRYIKSELLFLLNRRKYHLLPISFLRNALKYVGYKLGQNYKNLPRVLVKRLTFTS